MSDSNQKAGAKPMPVTGSGCGIRPSKEAMEVEFGVDFSEAKQFLQSDQDSDSPVPTNKTIPAKSDQSVE